MKYCVVIIDGASGWPLPERGNKTCLELARIPNLDRMAGEGTLGMVRTVPEGMEPSSACACMSIMGYDPMVYYHGRSGIEAVSMGIPVGEDEVTFRCNLVAVQDGRMRDYSAGHIGDSEAHALVDALQRNLGDESIHFYRGVGYRHICKIKGHQDTLKATCTPPHDIPDKPIEEFIPHGLGSDLLRELMERSVNVLRDHPVNKARESRGELPATMIWLFWGSGRIPQMPLFKEVYGLDAAMTSGVGLLKGMAKMVGVENLDIPGVTDGLDNDYAAQAGGALKALGKHGMVFIHIEAPDESGHAGHIDDKIEAIERVDSEVVGRLLSKGGGDLRILAMPDHPTPIEARTHVSDPVPFVLWGPGFRTAGAGAFSEAEAKGTGIFIEDGYTIMGKLLKG
ncbi:MAG TPA: cofactor-independent phosphoglycerate mutase [Dehalococcoidia bacterium]|nr:cofactor-independent phosphoglycerate mutase [Dehalococcoidia bacterium]